ncbi:MAG: hypothetical protein ACW98F_04305 [Candidatus Hodarchaeales archaeon]|jgi:preprotein translocase subunit SecY
MTLGNLEENKSIKSDTENTKELSGKDSDTKKYLVTLGVIIAYSILTMIPLAEVNLGGGDPYASTRIISASMQGTLAELGILPLLTAGLLMYLSLKLNLYKMDTLSQEKQNRYNQVRLLLSILLTIILALLMSISGLYGVDLDFSSQVAIIIQLTIAGIVIILLNELINRGWGLGSGISLFLACGIGLRLMQSFLAPNNILEGPTAVVSARGIIFALLSWIGKEGPIKAFVYLFFRYSSVPTHNLNLPSLSLFSVYLAGIFFVLIVILETFNPRRRQQERSEAKNKSIQAPVLPIVLTTTLLALVRIISLFIWNTSGRENSTSGLTWILGSYRLDTTTEVYVPTGGLAYIFSPPHNILEGLTIDLLPTIFQGIIYSAVFLGLYMTFSKMRIQIGNSIAKNSEENTVEKRWLLIGIMCVISDLFNLLAVGLGIILLAMIIVSYYQLITGVHLSEFARFDLESQDKLEGGKVKRERVIGGYFWLITILLGVGLFFLRVVVFTILGRVM